MSSPEDGCTEQLYLSRGVPSPRIHLETSGDADGKSGRRAEKTSEAKDDAVDSWRLLINPFF